jgi:hypothetical protein
MIATGGMPTGFLELLAFCERLEIGRGNAKAPVTRLVK